MAVVYGLFVAALLPFLAVIHFKYLTPSVVLDVNTYVKRDAHR